MIPHRANSRDEATSVFPLLLKLAAAMLLATFSIATAAQEADLTPGITYVCNGERMFIEGCNVRDLSDTATCMVGHPDHVLPNGLMQYTTMTRGALKKLFPTCTQPSAKQVAAAKAFQKRQQDIYNANVAKAEEQMKAPTAPPQSGGGYGQPAPPKTPEEREMRRCVSSGRLPASCTGNALLGQFGQMLNSVVKITKDPPPPGPTMAGVFQGREAGASTSSTMACSSTAPTSRPISTTTRSSSERAARLLSSTPLPSRSSSPTGPTGQATEQ